MSLTVKDALAEGVVEVAAEARPPLEHAAETLYAVFAVGMPKRFLGLVSAREVAANPGWIFADLIPKPQPTLPPEVPLDRVFQRMEQENLGYFPVVDEQGHFLGAVTRLSIYKALLAENRCLMRRLLKQQEEERRYLARELHDELGQHLAALQAELGHLALALGEAFQPKLEAISQTLEQLCVILQRVVYRLRPVVLDHLGLVEALRELIAEYRRHYPSIGFALKAVGNFKGLSDEHAIALYRVVQECLTNAVRHAQARRVTVTLRSTPLCLTVSDDGRGLSQPQTGLGLLGMWERVEALGGVLQVSSQPNQGTQITVKWP